MPKYVYHCDQCNGNFEVVHGMTEKQEECKICFSFSCLRRIPQMPNIKTSDRSIKENNNTGDLVKKAIEENSKILKEQKKEATSWEYEPS